MSRPTDIIVVGAGIVGCAIAYELARRGASVQVVDDRAPGMGATHASAGILAPFIEAEADSHLLALTVRSLQLFDDFIARVANDSGLPIPYRRTGTMQIAMDPDSMGVLRNAAARLEMQGVQLVVVDAQAARAEEPHLDGEIAGGLLISAHGFVAVAELIRSLAAGARRHGAQLIEGARVRRITRAGADLTVETDRGPLTGNAVVMAAGSWSGQIDIAGVSKVPVRPVRGQLVRLAWLGPPLRRVLWSDRCYLVPWDDGTLLVGATMEDAGFEERTTVAGVRDLLDAACELVPRAWTSGFLGARAGLRPATPDGLPIIGASRVLPNLMYATGHFRNGILLAPLTARIVADAMLDNTMDRAMPGLRPERFGDL
jgi:glycine oxidase